MKNKTDKQKLILEYRGETIVNQVAEILEQSILSGDLSPGEKLSELMVSKQFNISRIPAREALQKLEEMNLVQKTYRGRVVSKFSLEEFEEIYELKNGVESYGAMLGSNRSTGADIEKIKKVITQMEDAINQQDHESLKHINYYFHDLLVHCSKNSKIINTFTVLVKQVRWATSLSFDLPYRPKEALKEHLAIFNAFKDKNGKKVRDLLETHSKNNLERIITSMQSK